MTVVKSKPYNIGVSLSEYHFSYDNDKLIGISKLNDSNVFVPLDPSSSEFSEIKSDDKSVRAFNIAKFNKEGVTDTVDVANDEVLTSYYNTQKKKLDNKQFIEEESEVPIAAVPKRQRTAPKEVLSYPLDIDINQDHLKINRFKYKRPDTGVQASRPPQLYEDDSNNSFFTSRGDSVKGTSYGQYQGGVILPMPKVSDSNGAQWGESDLDVFSLGIAAAGQQIGGATVGGINAISDIFRGENIGGEQGFTEYFSQKTKELSGISGRDFKDIGIAGSGLFASTVAKAAGINIGADEFLARSGGRILNPNAELLFQGPVLRDFAFKFLMIARSKKEGEMIRKIIRWFKTGAAPVFNNRALLQTPSIFQLTYGRGQGNSDYFLPTVNKFNEMALRNITVDYAPDGFWSAYQDSQPVAVVVNLQFTELRPVYKQDQDYAASQNDTSVGY